MFRKKPLNYLLNFDLILTGITFLALVTVTFMGVIMRYFFNNPFVWLEEVQLMCFVWIAFFGGGAAFRTGSHVAIDVIVERLPSNIKKVAEVIICIIVLSTLVFYSIQGFNLVKQLTKTGRATNILKIPYLWIYSAFPIGCILMMINYLIAEVPLFFKTRVEGKVGEIK